MKTKTETKYFDTEQGLRGSVKGHLLVPVQCVMYSVQCAGCCPSKMKVQQSKKDESN